MVVLVLYVQGKKGKKSGSLMVVLQTVVAGKHIRVERTLAIYVKMVIIKMSEIYEVLLFFHGTHAYNSNIERCIVE